MTTLFILLTLLLTTLFGLVPALVLVPRNPSGDRLLLMPVLGLATGVIFTNFLASFDWTGRSIAIVTLLSFALATGIFRFRVRLLGGWVAANPNLKRWLIVRWLLRPVQPIAAEEWRRAAPVLVLAAAVTTLIIWPYLRIGYADFWGSGNPDQAFYMQILERLNRQPLRDSHSLTAMVLGLSYFAPILSFLTGVQVKYFFGTLCASMVFLIPIAAYYLATAAFRLGARVGLLLAATVGCSTLIAGTFYIDALGSLSVAVWIPVGVVQCLQFADRPSRRRAFLLAIVTTAMYYCYYPGFGLMGLMCGLILVYALLRRSVSFGGIRYWLVATIVLLTCTSLFQSKAIFKQLLLETFSARLKADLGNEVLMWFAPYLTEAVIPFLWGLKLPNVPVRLGSLSGSPAFIVLFALGAVFTVVALMGMVRRVSGLRPEYRLMLAAICALLATYTWRRNGYGVFKLAGWVHPFVLLGFVAASVGMYQTLRRTRLRGWAVAAFVPLVTLTGLNLKNTVALGFDCLNKDTLFHDAAHYELRDFRRLEELDAKWGRAGFNMTLPDPVVQRWAATFLESPKPQFFPIIELQVDDSNSPRAERRLQEADKRRDSSYLLRSEDIVSPGRPAGCPSLWNSGVFELVDTRVCENVLVLGSGWYRMERNPGSPIHWLQRFRWMRKRGELLLFHPSAAPQRLRFAVVAGYGNPSPQRTIRVLLNGVPFDEIYVSGYAWVVTKPFVARNPWSRIEFEVEEQSAPLPRALAWWNRWVPRDPRILNAAFHDIAVVSEEEAVASSRSAVDFHSQDAFSGVNMNGVYPDRWIGAEASVDLLIPPSADVLELSGMVPGLRSFAFPYGIRAFADNTLLGETRIAKAGPFHVRVPLRNWKPASAGRAQNVRILIKPATTFIGRELGINADQRPLSIMLDNIGVRQGDDTPQNTGKLSRQKARVSGTGWRDRSLTPPADQCPPGRASRLAQRRL